MEPNEMNDNLRSLLDKDFIMPAHSYGTSEGNLVGKYLYSAQGSDSREYYKDVISVVLAQLGDKKGVSFGTFPNSPGEEALGKYIHDANQILLNELIASRSPLAFATQIVAHEAYHKHLEEKNASAKYMGANQHKFLEGHHPEIPELLGLGHDKFFYRLNNNEKQTYAYNQAFITSFLTQARDLAKFMKDPEKQQFVEREKEYVDGKNAVIQKEIETCENTFISKTMPIFYDAANKTFNSLVTFFLDTQVNPRDEVERNHALTVSKLNSVYPNGKASPYTATAAMCEILGACPQAEKVETFVSLVTTSRFDVGAPIGDIATRSRVPLTQTDFTRIALASHSENLELPELFNPQYLDRIDEATWAKNLVATMGVSGAKLAIADFKMSGKMPNTNFEVADKMLASLSAKPLITIGGKPIYSCRELLQVVTKSKTSQYSKFSNNVVYYQTCGECAKSLANIVSHFGTPDPNNKEFVSALQNFAKDPYTIQFKETEKRSEVGTLYSPVVCERIAEYIGEVRSQGTQNNPLQTQYNPTNAVGETYATLTENSANELAEALSGLGEVVKGLADVLKDMDVKTLLGRLGIEQNVATIKEENGKQTVHIETATGSKTEDEIVVTVRDSGKNAIASFKDTQENDAQYQGPEAENADSFIATTGTLEELGLTGEGAEELNGAELESTDGAEAEELSDGGAELEGLGASIAEAETLGDGFVDAEVPAGDNQFETDLAPIIDAPIQQDMLPQEAPVIDIAPEQ